MSNVAASGRFGVAGSVSTGGGPSCDADDDDVGPFEVAAIGPVVSGSMQYKAGLPVVVQVSAIPCIPLAAILVFAGVFNYCRLVI